LINVQRRADASHKMGKLKSKSGYRSIPLPPMVDDALKEWKLACPRVSSGWSSRTGLRGKMQAFLKSAW
jgi:hypothetical protein